MKALLPMCPTWEQTVLSLHGIWLEHNIPHSSTSYMFFPVSSQMKCLCPQKVLSFAEKKCFSNLLNNLGG